MKCGFYRIAQLLTGGNSAKFVPHDADSQQPPAATHRELECKRLAMFIGAAFT